MSDDFDILYHSTAPCCGEDLGWEWDEDELCFVAECGCTNGYQLIPSRATVVASEDSDEF